MIIMSSNLEDQYKADVFKLTGIALCTPLFTSLFTVIINISQIRFTMIEVAAVSVAPALLGAIAIERGRSILEETDARTNAKTNRRN